MAYYILENPIETRHRELAWRLWLELKSKVAIDRKFLQRVLDHWGEDQVQKYLNGLFRGHRHIDSFVLVSIDEIIRVLKGELKLLKKNKELQDDKSKLQDFIDKMQGYKDAGKDWMLINGQHRDDSLTRWVAGKVPNPSNFSKKIKLKFEDGRPLTSTEIDGKLFPKMDEGIKNAFLAQTHPFTFVTGFEDMEDLADIVRFMNTGNDWNPNEWRAISPSYIMQKFTDMNDYADFKTIFALETNKTKPYSLKRKGVVWFLSHMYYTWVHSKSSNWTDVPQLTDETYDDMIKISSDLWTPKSVDEFLTFAKTVAKEFATLVPVLKVKGKWNVPASIPTFRNYFHFRIILNTYAHPLNNEVYKVKDSREFPAMWLQQENFRQSLREQLNDEGKKTWDDYEANKDPLGMANFVKNWKSGLTKEVKKYIKDNYLAIGKHYLADNKSAMGGKNLNNVMAKQVEDFLKVYDEWYAKGYVKRQGSKPNSSIKKEVYTKELASAKPELNMDDILDLLDGKKNHVGHQQASQNDGGYDLGNLKLESAEHNLSNKENR